MGGKKISQRWLIQKMGYCAFCNSTNIFTHFLLFYLLNCFNGEAKNGSELPLLFLIQYLSSKVSNLMCKQRYGEATNTTYPLCFIFDSKERIFFCGTAQITFFEKNVFF